MTLHPVNSRDHDRSLQLLPPRFKVGLCWLNRGSSACNVYTHARTHTFKSNDGVSVSEVTNNESKFGDLVSSVQIDWKYVSIRRRTEPMFVNMFTRLRDYNNEASTGKLSVNKPPSVTVPSQAFSGHSKYPPLIFIQYAKWRNSVVCITAVASSHMEGGIKIYYHCR